MTKPDYVVSVASILHNDEAVVDQFTREVTAVLAEKFRYFELVLLDNHSNDGTTAHFATLLSELPGIRVIRLSRNRKLEVALSALLDHCIGDYVITLDCRSDPPDLIPKIEAMLVGGVDVLIGQRPDEQSGWARRLLSRAGRRLTASLLEVEAVDNTGICHGFTRRALNSITKIRSKSRYILYDSLAIGYRHAVLPYVQDRRPGARTSSDPFFGALSGRVQMIIAHSLFPLRLAGVLGVAGSLANIVYLVYIFGVALFKRRIVEGWITSSLLNTTMFFTLFVILAILSEYMGRILEESKDQPAYFVESEMGSSVSTYDQHRLNVVSD